MAAAAALHDATHRGGGCCTASPIYVSVCQLLGLTPSNLLIAVSLALSGHANGSATPIAAWCWRCKQTCAASAPKSLPPASRCASRAAKASSGWLAGEMPACLPACLPGLLTLPCVPMPAVASALIAPPDTLVLCACVDCCPLPARCFMPAPSPNFTLTAGATSRPPW